MKDLTDLTIVASVMVFLFLATPNTIHAQRRMTTHSFEQYAVPVYRGALAKPNFKSLSGSRQYRTRIGEGIRDGVNFAGRSSIIEIGCGTSCRFVFLADVKSGKIFNFPLGGEENYSLSLDYRANSKLLKASWING